jgi:hypothetical protein
VPQEVKLRGKTLCLEIVEVLEKEEKWTVVILLKEFTKSRRPLDLLEEHGGYGEFSKAQAQASN